MPAGCCSLEDAVRSPGGAPRTRMPVHMANTAPHPHAVVCSISGKSPGEAWHEMDRTPAHACQLRTVRGNVR